MFWTCNRGRRARAWWSVWLILAIPINMNGHAICNKMGLTDRMIFDGRGHLCYLELCHAIHLTCAPIDTLMMANHPIEQSTIAITKNVNPISIGAITRTRRCRSLRTTIHHTTDVRSSRSCTLLPPIAWLVTWMVCCCKLTHIEWVIQFLQCNKLHDSNLNIHHNDGM